jgi:hypothetical protein
MTRAHRHTAVGEEYVAHVGEPKAARRRRGGGALEQRPHELHARAVGSAGEHGAKHKRRVNDNEPHTLTRLHAKPLGLWRIEPNECRTAAAHCSSTMYPWLAQHVVGNVSMQAYRRRITRIQEGGTMARHRERRKRHETLCPSPAMDTQARAAQ